LNNVDADRLIERARSIRPSVNISAVNLHWTLVKKSFWMIKEEIYIPQNSMTVHTSVLEVDTRRTASADDNLELNIS